jgi:hypothetical protein
MSFDRVPVSIALDGEGETVTVTCDDGAVFVAFLKGKVESVAWDELPPVPGSQADGLLQRNRFLTQMQVNFPVAEWDDMMIGFHNMSNGDVANARAQAKTLIARSKEVGSSVYLNGLELAVDILGREGWPDFIVERIKAAKKAAK